MREQYENLLLKHQLTSKLLDAKSENKGLKSYKEILYTDFLDFANKEESLANEAEAILKLQSIEKELELIAVYPKLYKKSIVAVGGGFSAGKSRFINSFLEDLTIKLPEGVRPTTAIPAYVMNSDKNELLACNHNGGFVDLYDLDKNFHSKLSHDFIRSFEFNLNTIMPFMVIVTPIKELENLCFIDTPGYNPSDIDGGYTNEDKNTAQEFLENSQTLLWLVGLDSNGTIPLSDLNFLEELDLEDKSLYIVLNKADLKAKSDIEDIIDEIEETLEDYEIDFEGISAYSSVRNEEIHFSKKSLLDFLDSRNKVSKVQNILIKKLYEVYAMYERAILKNIKTKKLFASQLNSLSIDLLQKGFDEMSSPLHRRIENLKNIYSTKLQEENLKRLEVEIIKLKDAIDEVFAKKSRLVLEKTKDSDIELDYDFSLEEKSDRNVKNE